MMKLNKTLAIFVFFTSVAFMGFALAVWAGGPNWKARAEELPEFSIEAPSAPETPYTVKWRLKDDQISGQPASLPAAIVAAQGAKVTAQQDELQQLEQQIPVVQSGIEQAKSAIATDLKAMSDRQAELDKQLRELTATIVATAKEADAKTQEAQQKYGTLKLRREEYLMMSTQLKELRAERQLAEAEVQKLRDLLMAMKGNLERAERRQKLLKQDVAKYDE